MMSALPKPRRFSDEEYLMLEEKAERRSQFYLGEIFLMAGATRRHNVISTNVTANLHAQLRRKPCEIYQNDMRVKIHKNFYTYPDVVVVCGEPKIERRHGENLLNPIVLIEVLSRSTEQFDRGEKAKNYRTIDSLQELILISQDKPGIEHYARQPNGAWLISEITGAQAVLKLDSIECELHLADIYERVDFDTITEDLTDEVL
jgi:Uma2 family endonuclease